MKIVLRGGTPADSDTCGTIGYRAFKAISEEHNFPPDLPSAEVARKRFADLLSHPSFYSVVAEIDGRVVGSNFLDERSSIAGVGPITVDPAAQNQGVGLRLMEDVLERARHLSFPSVRLVQAAYHNRSMSLYTKLGFEAREPLTTLQGEPIDHRIPGYDVRPAKASDQDACNHLCARVHGHDRGGELLDAIKRGSATVVEREGRISGYSTLIGYNGHAVGESNDDLRALIASAPSFPGPGFLVPTRNTELLRWGLSQGLRIVQPMTLMSIGLYNEPAGRFLPSVWY